MLISRIVIDTNIYISGIFWGGKPRAIVDLGRSGQVLIFTSLEIEEEVEKKLKTKFGLSDEEAAQIRSFVNQSMSQVSALTVQQNLPPEVQGQMTELLDAMTGGNSQQEAISSDTPQQDLPVGSLTKREKENEGESSAPKRSARQNDTEDSDDDSH